MLLHDRPAKAHFLPEASTGQSEALAVVVHKAGCAIQIGMAVPADAVFFLQEILRFLGRGMAVIQSGNPKPSTGKA